MTQSKKDVVVAFYEQVLNARNLNKVDEFLSPLYLDHNAFAGMDPHREGFKEIFAGTFAGFPDFSSTIQQIVAEEDWVVVREKMEGTQQGEFMGMSPTGKKFSVQAINMLKVVDNQIVERWGNFDEMELMKQLGITP